jgi:tRNA 2-thiocytidine biosynthesis protein TtcA
MLNDLEARHPGTKTSMLAALQNVRPSHLLDRALWSCLGLEAARDLAPVASATSAEETNIVPSARLVRGANAPSEPIP